MPSKNEQFKALIEHLVQKEVRKIVPHLVKEVMANMILESRTSTDNMTIADNSYKRRAITELNENRNEDGFEEYPTMSNKRLSRMELAEHMGYGDDFSNVGGQSNLITVTSTNPEGDIGSGRPIDPRSIPPELIQAFNRDYRPLMKALNKNNG